MRTNLEQALIDRPRILSPLHEILRFDLTGTFVIPTNGAEYQFLNGGLSDRTIFLPAISPTGGQFFMINNVGVTNDLNVVNSLGVAQATVQEASSAIFVSSRTGWSVLPVLSSASSALLTKMLLWSTQTITAGTGTVASTDVHVWVNFAGAVALTMPDAAAWLTAHPFSDLVIKDISGAAGANNITLNRAGSDLMDGAASLDITSNFGGFRFKVSAANKWSIV